MKLSTTTAICRTRPDGPKLSIDESAVWIQKAGFDAVDANFFFSPNEPDTPLVRDDWDAWAHALRERYAALSLPFEQAHAPAYSYVLPGEGVDERIQLLFKRSFAVSGILGAQWIVVHPLSVHGAASASASMRANKEYFKPLLDMAAENGLSIAVENMFDGFHYVGGGKGKTDSRFMRVDAPVRILRRFGSGLDELLELVDMLHATHPNVGVCWDTGHANEMAIPQAEALDLVGSRLKALHINDNFAVYDDHSVPFHGSIGCWSEIMKALKRIRYAGSLTLETGKFSARVPTPLVQATLAYTEAIGRYLISLYDQA